MLIHVWVPVRVRVSGCLCVDVSAHVSACVRVRVCMLVVVLARV